MAATSSFQTKESAFFFFSKTLHGASASGLPPLICALCSKGFVSQSNRMCSLGLPSVSLITSFPPAKWKGRTPVVCAAHTFLFLCKLDPDYSLGSLRLVSQTWWSVWPTDTAL